MVDPAFVAAQFERHFGQSPQRLFRAPGRVNLIGEHTDYNDGFVLPVAIDRDVVMAVRPNSSSGCRIVAIDKKSEESFTLGTRDPLSQGRWINYLQGVSRVLESRGYGLQGIDVAFASDIPIGAGLSSSAALEIAAGISFEATSGLRIDPVEMALICQQAEHESVGTMCGIMDQFVSRMGQKDSALLIDCRALTMQTVHVPMRDHKLIICDTGVKHHLATSAYNERRRECETALEVLKAAVPSAKALRDIDLASFAKVESSLVHPLRERARHVISEIARTLKAATALEAGDFASLKQLMHESHGSLRDDYEVSAPELDILAEHAESLKGECGTRMTGGGFGGCTVSFVERAFADAFVSSMTKHYRKMTGLALHVIDASIIDGAMEIT